MQLTIVGNRAAMPADGAASSGYLVETERARILLDCGPGIALALTRYIHAGELDAVVISHMHSDHCYDVLPIGKQIMQFHSRTRPADTDGSGDFHGEAAPKRTTLLVPAGARATLDRLAALFPVRSMPHLDRAFELAYEVVEYEPGDTYSVGDATVRLIPMVHSEPNCGVRIDSPSGSIAYTGDTGRTDDLLTLARDADIFLAEATLAQPDRTGHGHLSATEAGRAAAAAGAHSVVLTHFTTPDADWKQSRRTDAVAEFAGPVHVGEPGMRFTVVPAGK
ncbi:MBL fold metallo-hydrolase [Nocardia sp. alder85J]|uniref:MBL fold metallo-hydrolase n=1 Tax=Nocardia sp. alder85J TaxID=2862949 RepID=UPI001CD27E4E|nr:MBL fold metallo-hydrolase [Nocardia sp. alder85J]MCX4094960.1 MBL fold metallo-hydrolase [Nocardia sp. alder85J]